MDALIAYIPQDRVRALASGVALPKRAHGAILFADISGFTPLTEAFSQALGSRRGAEMTTYHVDSVYNALIAIVEQYGGSVISFAGDAIICWFAGERGPRRATVCALALQAAMQPFATLPIAGDIVAALGLKIVVSTGLVRRFVVGDPTIQRLDVLAGAMVTRLGQGESLVRGGETLADAATIRSLGRGVTVSAWRSGDQSDRFALLRSAPTAAVVPARATPVLPPYRLKEWVLPAVYARENTGQGTFLTEFRPCVALFMRFTGLDYEQPDAEPRLDKLVRHVQQILSRYGGTLLQLTIGDKGSYCYGAFGAPVVHEDDARRAVTAALELRTLSNKLPWLAPLQIGLSYGTMRAGAYGAATRRTYGVLGDAVNVAARLMQKAAPGEILISDRLQRVLPLSFSWEPRPPVQLKGKAQPVSVSVITGVRQMRALRLQEPVFTSPMVGRVRELGAIRDQIERAAHGRGQVVGIVAEAGLGKSRLLAEAIRAAHQRGFEGYGGACQSDGVNSAYLVWRPIWSAFFGVDPALPAQHLVARLDRELELRAPARREALPLLGDVLGVALPENSFTGGLEPEYRKSTIEAVLLDCLSIAVHATPLLLVLEDAHWLDALSHDLLDTLARGIAGLPVLIILAYRPPELQRLHAPRVESLPYFTRITLEPLTADEAALAIRAKLVQLYPQHDAEPPAQLVERLMARAQGNPFYLEELINYLHDRGADPHDPAVLAQIALPDSLHTLILSRLDQLTELEQSILKVASVIGRIFLVAWLTGYYPGLAEAATVRATLETLRALDLTLLETPEPELTYLFKHIATREVAYESLPYALRSHLHELLAAYLESHLQGQSSALDLLVYHYGRSNNIPKQREYLHKAAVAAYARSDFLTAVTYNTRLLELTSPESAVYAGLARQLGEAQLRLGNFAEAWQALELACMSAQSGAEQSAALALQGEVRSRAGDYADATRILAQALALARASGDAATLAGTLSALGEVSYRMGKLADARQALEECLALARARSEVTRTLFALWGLALVYRADQQLDEAERLLKDVLALAQAVGNRERAMAALNSLGSVLDDRRDYAAARDAYLQALASAREIGAQLFIALCLINLGGDEIHLGQLADARAHLREGLTLAQRVGAGTVTLYAIVNFAELAYLEGDFERAIALFRLARRHPAWDIDLQSDYLDAGMVPRHWQLDRALLTEWTELDWEQTVLELQA
jgi:class 3 adenylate cyclase/predicted ATPase